MRKLIIRMLVAGAALAGGYAVAQIVPALPFQLQNNTVADATQVMANFNQIRNGVNTNTAKNGVNSDITALLGLTTPLSPSQGGTTTWVGGTSTGSANAQVVATVVPTTFTLARGTRVVFQPGFTFNTGLMTLNVAGSGVRDVWRPTQFDREPTVGGEVIQRLMTSVIYDGAVWQIETAPYFVGEMKDYAGAFVPSGYLAADGSCVSQAAYPILFIVIGSSWGTCGAGDFALPDTRARATIAPDAGANRVTNAGSGCTAVVTAGCGAQNQTVLQANLPALTWPKTLAVGNGTLAATAGTLAVSNGTLAASNGTLAGTIGTLAGTIGTLAGTIGSLAISDTRTWQTANSLYSTGANGARAAGTEFSLAATQQSVTSPSGSIGLTGAPSLSGAPGLSGTPSLSGAVTLTGAISMSGAPALSGAVALTGDTTSGGSGTPVTTLPPTLVVTKMIKL